MQAMKGIRSESWSQDTPRKLPLCAVGRQLRYRKGEMLELTITDYAFGGKGIAKIPTESGAFSIFVQNSLPGQRVKAQVTKCKNRFAECRLVDVLDRSPDEVSIPYQEIPGAPYAHLPIEKQHAFKHYQHFPCHSITLNLSTWVIW